MSDDVTVSYADLEAALMWVSSNSTGERQMPHKNDLDLGRSLALGFAQEAMPQDYDVVRAYFNRSGAYARFKDLLGHRGPMERWFAFENEATREALLEWAAECGFRVADETPAR